MNRKLVRSYRRSYLNDWLGRTRLQDGDYVSRSLKFIVPDEAFPQMTIGDKSGNDWPYLRREIDHNWFVDKRTPTWGFLNRDEASVLYNLALPFRGKACLEIGCWRGWSTVHLAAATKSLDVIDPVLFDPEFREELESSLRACRLASYVRLHPGKSPQAIEEVARGRRFSFIFIDGNHDGDAPLKDAQGAVLYAGDDAMIVFHDLASPDVAAGLHWLHTQGWKTYFYQTMQIIGVAVRGSAKVVAHTPDPAQKWSTPPHLRPFELAPSGNVLQKLL